MATTRSNSGFDITLDAGRTYFNHKIDFLRDRLARYKVYRNTHSELSSLSNRDLNDLGISRSGIKRLAMEAAYDC
jgi:uncharacterized protein YjiS (DUF1127 family)